MYPIGLEIFLEEFGEERSSGELRHGMLLRDNLEDEVEKIEKWEDLDFL